MGLFGRRRKDADAAQPQETPEAVAEITGPFDISQVEDTGNRLNLGSLYIPPRPGLQMRVELDRNTKVPISVTLALGGSSVQVQLFAAPRSASLWDEIRPALAQSAKDKDGVVDDVPGVFGRELLVKLPVTTKGGSGMKPVRFAGIDGPRWLLRVVFHGDAALSKSAAEPLEELVRDIVVDRGVEARPPREPIPLRLPGQENVEKSDESQDPLAAVTRRGPEITETR